MVLEMLVTVSHFAVTTPAILVICLGATIFLTGIVTLTLFFYKRKTSFSNNSSASASASARRKGGVFLTDDFSSSPGEVFMSEQHEREHEHETEQDNILQVPLLILTKTSRLPPPQKNLAQSRSSRLPSTTTTCPTSATRVVFCSTTKKSSTNFRFDFVDPNSSTSSSSSSSLVASSHTCGGLATARKQQHNYSSSSTKPPFRNSPFHLREDGGGRDECEWREETLTKV